jgi:hypothetical protein
MITKRFDKNRFYYIECGNWAGVTVASSHKEACEKLFSQAHDVFKDDIKLTKVSVVADCEKLLNKDNDDIVAFLSDEVMEVIAKDLK